MTNSFILRKYFASRAVFCYWFRTWDFFRGILVYFHKISRNDKSLYISFGYQLCMRTDREFLTKNRRFFFKNRDFSFFNRLFICSRVLVFVIEFYVFIRVGFRSACLKKRISSLTNGQISKNMEI